jgi:ATP-dependent Clp protease, protease subunit
MKIVCLLIPVLLSGCLVINQPPAAQTGQVRVDYNDPVLNNRQVLLVGGLDKQVAELTIQKLLYLDKKGTEPIDLYLFSPGGDLLTAFSIEQVMKTLKCKVNTFALAECNSGGAFLLAAGTGERVAFSNAVIVVHGMVVNGKTSQKKLSKEELEATKRLQDYYTAGWKRRTHLPDEWLPIPPGKTIFLTAQEALKYGLVDKVLDK